MEDPMNQPVNVQENQFEETVDIPVPLNNRGKPNVICIILLMLILIVDIVCGISWFYNPDQYHFPFIGGIASFIIIVFPCCLRVNDTNENEKITLKKDNNNLTIEYSDKKLSFPFENVIRFKYRNGEIYLDLINGKKKISNFDCRLPPEVVEDLAEILDEKLSKLKLALIPSNL